MIIIRTCRLLLRQWVPQPIFSSGGSIEGMLRKMCAGDGRRGQQSRSCGGNAGIYDRTRGDQRYRGTVGGILVQLGRVVCCLLIRRSVVSRFLFLEECWLLKMCVRRRPCLLVSSHLSSRDSQDAIGRNITRGTRGTPLESLAGQVSITELSEQLTTRKGQAERVRKATIPSPLVRSLVRQVGSRESTVSQGRLYLLRHSVKNPW